MAKQDLFGIVYEEEKVDAAASLGTQIARQLYAMVTKKKGVDLSATMKNERYQRTFTDEYLFGRKPSAREPVSAEIREGWKKLILRGG